MGTIKTLFTTFIIFSFFCTVNAQTTNYPHLRNNGQTKQLIVDGSPILLLCGELGNSSSSTPAYTDMVLAKCKQLGLNSVIAGICWDQFEPSEGSFDYTNIDGLISSAEKYGLKLVVIWFGSYKNGLSSYTPIWVKTEQKRFPRVIGPSMEALISGQDSISYYKNILSPFFEATWKADAKAFAALMHHIKMIDKHHTVVMIQVENEAGTYGVDIDRQPVAKALFNSPVPGELIRYLKQHQSNMVPTLKEAWSKSGNKENANWTETFGEQAIDAFMSWHFAKFIEHVAAAGKAEYNIPMYCNAWLLQPKHKGKQGRYPTGGPIHTMLDIYNAAAPSIDLLSPDIYSPDFKQYCIAYKHAGNTLFIPECRLDEALTAKASWVFGDRAAIGFAPFGIERLSENSPIVEGYKVLKELMPFITKYQGTDRLKAVYKQEAPKHKGINVGEWDFDAGELTLEDKGYTQVTFGQYIFNVEFNGKQDGCFAMFIQLSNDEFIVTGNNVRITFLNVDKQKVSELLYAEQGNYAKGRWVTRRHLNGDETAHGVAVSFPTSNDTFALENRQDIVKLRLYSYQSVVK